MFNEIIVFGKLVNKPTIKETTNGIKLSTIVLDVERPYRNNLGIHEHDYITCVLWRGVSEMVNDYCEIGSLIGVKGRLQSRTFDISETHSSTVIEVKVEHVEFVEKYLKKEK